MYGDGEFLSRFINKLGLDVELPSKGTLDLNLVLDDEFFFS